MAPLSEAIKTNFSFVKGDGTAVYKGVCDPEWSISVPHGGYILSTVMDALLQHQSSTHHKAPAHITAQFLVASSISPLEVHIKTFSTSKRWTRLDISLIQYSPQGIQLLRLRAHALFSDLPSLDDHLLAPSPSNVTIMPGSPSQFARTCPLAIHPSLAKVTPMHPDFAFRERVKWSEGVQEKVAVVGGEGGSKKMEWGAWFELIDQDQDIRKNASLIPFFADMFMNGPETLPLGEAPAASWFPTLTLSLDFKTKFPLPSSSVSARTVGLYAVSDFVHEGRHDEKVEVWSAPSNIGEKITVGSDEWRKRCRIIAVSTQMALVIPSPVRTAQSKL